MRLQKLTEKFWASWITVASPLLRKLTLAANERFRNTRMRWWIVFSKNKKTNWRGKMCWLGPEVKMILRIKIRQNWNSGGLVSNRKGWGVRGARSRKTVKEQIWWESLYPHIYSSSIISYLLVICWFIYHLYHIHMCITMCTNT